MCKETDGSAGTPEKRKEKKGIMYSFMIQSWLKEILTVAAELSGHEKGISSNRQRQSIQLSTLIIGSP